MIKNAMLKHFPKLTEKQVRIYGFVLFALGTLYVAYALMLVVCYLPASGTLIRGLVMAMVGSYLGGK